MNKNKLNPECVFEQFAKINAIPRPSKHEEKMIAFLKDFGESRGLETIIDETGNVLIRKSATPGYENRETIILQSHMDMVCEKLPECTIDFNNDPIETYVDGEWLRAKGTTLALTMVSVSLWSLPYSTLTILSTVLSSVYLLVTKKQICLE